MALTEVYSSVLPIIDVDKQVKQKDIVPISPANITYYTYQLLVLQLEPKRIVV